MCRDMIFYVALFRILIKNGTTSEIELLTVNLNLISEALEQKIHIMYS